MKSVLVISFSQTGQLNEIVENFLTPFLQEQIEIERVKISPQTPYPFPWDAFTFFDLMPDTVNEIPSALAPYTLKKEKYDLIIVGYQPWFLSPSLPATALFNDEKFRKVLKDTPVATIIGARNMWTKSQESIVKWVEEAGGFMVANIPFIDRVQNYISALTVLHWMEKGKKTRRWGFLPKPGVSKKDIGEAAKYAPPLVEGLLKGDYENVQKKIIAKGGISVKSTLMLVEARGKKFFKIWTNLINKKGTTPRKRKFWVKAFEWYLIIALFVISPPILIIHLLLKPLMLGSVRKKQHFYLFLGINR